jgi:hypothetical protein
LKQFCLKLLLIFIIPGRTKSDSDVTHVELGFDNPVPVKENETSLKEQIDSAL